MISGGLVSGFEVLQGKPDVVDVSIKRVDVDLLTNRFFKVVDLLKQLLDFYLIVNVVNIL